MNIIVVDYNAGNLASLVNSLIKASQETSKEISIKVSKSPKDVYNSDKVILPGVGDFSHCKTRLEKIDGMVFNPLTNRWNVSQDCAVNYIIKFKKN